MKSPALCWRNAAAPLQLFLAGFLPLFLAPAAPAQEIGEVDAGLNARAHAAAALLIDRCASCHGPEGDDRKAIRGWADASDLASTVTDEEFIVRGVPDDSYLYLVIEDMDMPPPESDVSQLDEAERTLIADWIRDGAALPVALPSVTEDVPEEAPAEVVLDVPTEAAPEADDKPSEQAAAPQNWMKQPWPKWLGRFHPTVVHFPIALLTAALLAELLAKLLRRPNLQHAANFSYTLGALSTIPSATFGWLLAESTLHRGNELDYHRWLGVAVSVVAVLGMSVFYRRPGARLPLLLLLATLAGITGHLGGTLSYGSDWLAPPF